MYNLMCDDDVLKEFQNLPPIFHRTRMTTGRQIDVIIPRKPEPTG